MHIKKVFPYSWRPVSIQTLAAVVISAVMTLGPGVTLMLMPSTAHAQAQILDNQGALPDRDARAGVVAPTSRSRQCSASGTVSWNVRHAKTLSKTAFPRHRPRRL